MDNSTENAPSTDLTAAEYIERFTKFYEQTLNIGVAITEKATLHIGESIDVLLKDSERISNLSARSIEAIQKIQAEIIGSYKKENRLSLKDVKHRSSIRIILRALEKLASKDKQIAELINPIVTAMQYQDRTQQNLNNLAKFVRTWKEGLMGQCEASTIYDKENDNYNPMGNYFASLTTMQEERDILDKHFDIEKIATVESIGDDDEDGGISFFL